jgi:hypothetical protein
MRLFFVSDRVTQAPYFYASEAGIFFDRCRILEHALDISEETLKVCAKWTKAVMNSNKIKWIPNA